jgi:hypothetical protein
MLDLATLLEQVEAGALALPDFQRDFDWSDADVRSLLATVLRGWPAGSFLLMSGAPAYLRLRAIDGAPPVAATVQWVVLDGQQRITSLYHALYDVGDSVYAVDLQSVDVLNVDSIEESLRTFARTDWQSKYPDPADQATAKLLPLSALRSAADFFEWRDRAISGMLPNLANELGQSLTALYREELSGLHKYEFPAVVVPTDMEPAAIARIFERVNKSGLSLGAFDLVVATSYEASWNLRDQWEAAREELPYLADFFEQEEGMPVLQVLALQITGDLRESAVLSLRGAQVRDHWPEAAEAMSRALGFLVNECGVARAHWLPYRNVAVVLGASAQQLDLAASGDRFTRWFWATALGEAYDVASNTRAVADYEALVAPAGRWTDRPVLLSALRHGTRRTHGALWRGLMCALMTHGARDPILGEPLTRGTADLVTLPIALPEWSERKDLSPLHQRVIAQVLATSRSRADLRLLLKGQQPAMASDPQALESQFIGNHDLFPPNRSNFEDVISARVERVSRFVVQRGSRVVDDLTGVRDVETSL